MSFEAFFVLKTIPAFVQLLSVVYTLLWALSMGKVHCNALNCFQILGWVVLLKCKSVFFKESNSDSSILTPCSIFPCEAKVWNIK